MARSFLRVFVGLVLLAGFQQGTSGNEEPEDRQGALRLPDGSVLTPYGQGQARAPQNPPGYSPAIVPYPYYPEPYPYYPEPYPYIPEPYPYIPDQPGDYLNPLPPYHPPKPKSDFGRLLLLLYVFSGAFRPVTAAAATTTTASTAFPGTCQWGAWSTCSLICKGVRTRSRMCTGVTQSESETCNTETGFRPDGNWYRAANCYEYLWSTSHVTTKALANTACTDLGTRLASTGLRDNSVRSDIVSRFAIARGLDNIRDAYVGISNEADATTYVWTDGFEGDPTFWRAGEPSGAATACILLQEGNAYGLYDISCTDTSFSYLCERVAA